MLTSVSFRATTTIIYDFLFSTVLNLHVSNMKFIHVLRYLLFYCLPPNIFSQANTHLMREKSKEDVRRISHTIMKRFFPDVNDICSIYPDQPAHPSSSCENWTGTVYDIYL